MKLGSAETHLKYGQMMQGSTELEQSKTGISTVFEEVTDRYENLKSMMEGDIVQQYINLGDTAQNHIENINAVLEDAWIRITDMAVTFHDINEQAGGLAK